MLKKLQFIYRNKLNTSSVTYLVLMVLNVKSFYVDMRNLMQHPVQKCVVIYIIFINYRHGRGHTIMPTNVNFRANIWAMN
jgi:hypothetical protein